MIRASSVLFWFGLVIVTSLALYRTSDQVHALNLQLRDINTSIDSERQGIHVLKAEWVYLANPARVETAAKKHLALRPTTASQVVSLKSLAEALPTRTEAMGSVSVNATPLATVKTSLALPPVPIAKPKIVAVNDHINDHVTLRHTASSSASDTIGALLAELGSNP
jgi:cell division protein FtsL